MGIADSKRRKWVVHCLAGEPGVERDKGMPNGLSFNWEGMATEKREACLFVCVCPCYL
jgi:hypothetical protein